MNRCKDTAHLWYDVDESASLSKENLVVGVCPYVNVDFTKFVLLNHNLRLERLYIVQVLAWLNIVLDKAFSQENICFHDTVSQ